MHYIWHARNQPATPDSRKKGEALACNYSPSLFIRCNGPVSILKSFAKPNLMRVANGGPLAIELHDTMFRSEDSIRKVAQYVQSFMDLGGPQMQINAVNRDKIADAKNTPKTTTALSCWSIWKSRYICGPIRNPIFSHSAALCQKMNQGLINKPRETVESVSKKERIACQYVQRLVTPGEMNHEVSLWTAPSWKAGPTCTHGMEQKHSEATGEGAGAGGQAFLEQGIKGSVTLRKLNRLRELARQCGENGIPAGHLPAQQAQGAGKVKKTPFYSECVILLISLPATPTYNESEIGKAGRCRCGCRLARQRNKRRGVRH